MKTHRNIIASGFLFILAFCTAAMAQEKTGVYVGLFKGKDCDVTINWADEVGTGGVGGRIVVEKTVILNFKGRNLEDGSLEIDIQGQTHALRKEAIGGSISWVGDYLSITEVPGAAAGKGMTTPATGVKPPGTLGAKPPGTLGAKPPGTLGAKPPGTLGAKPPGTLGAKPPGTLGAKPPGTLGAKPPGTLGAKPPGTPGASDPTPAPQAEILTLTPLVWPVGKWPEGMAHDGNFLWVAESGQRNLAQINSDSGAVIERVSCGRLPVGMASNPVTGDVYAAVATDQKVVRYSRAAKGGTFASLSDYPNSISADETAVWVLMWIDGSNDKSRIVRFDQKSASSTKSELLGSGASNIAKSGNHLWTNHTRGTENAMKTLVSRFDPQTLKSTQTVELDGFLGGLAATEGSIFVCGGNWDVDGAVVRIDPVTMQETARKQIPDEFSYKIAADADYVVVGGAKGTLQVFSADDLTLMRTIHLDWKAYQPSSLLIVGDVLYIATHAGNGEEGSVLVLNDWAPMRGHP